MRVRQLNHTTYQVMYHLVWGTKYRRKVLKHYVRKQLIKSLYKTLRRHPDWYLHTVNTDLDHVHLMMEIPPKYSISKTVQSLKIDSSIQLKKHFPFIKRVFRKGSVWSTGYFVSTIGLNEQQIKKYIERQNQLDIGKDITDELS